MKISHYFFLFYDFLKKSKFHRLILKFNFAFSDGLGGAGCLTHGEKNKAEVDKYGKEALEKTISDAVALIK